MMNKLNKTINCSLLIFLMSGAIMPNASQSSPEATIIELLHYFQRAGLSVEEPKKTVIEEDAEELKQRESEREAADPRYAEAKEKIRQIMAERRQANPPPKVTSSKETPVETGRATIEFIQVTIHRYSNASYAQEAYDRMFKTEKWLEEKDRKNNRAHFKVTFFQNGPFILEIPHYELAEISPASPIEKQTIVINEGSLLKVKEAFEGIKF